MFEFFCGDNAKNIKGKGRYGVCFYKTSYKRKMTLDEILNSIDINNFQKKEYEVLKTQKMNLSNREKKELNSLFANAKNESKNVVLKAIICYAIWEPDEAIENARRKGIFRYKVFGNKKENNALYFLSFFVEHIEIFGFSDMNCVYLNQKRNSDWLIEFYSKTENKIEKIMQEHYKKRIRKRINNINIESSLHKELLAFIDMLFFLEDQKHIGVNFNSIASFTREEIAEGISYLFYIYVDKFGISQDKNYFIDTSFVLSSEMENLILLACQINHMVETELLVDFYNYDICWKEKEIIIRSNDSSFEKSIRQAYIKQEMQEMLFYKRRFSQNENNIALSQVAELIIDELEERIVKKHNAGVFSRYVFEIPAPLIAEVAKQHIKDKIELFQEEACELEFFAKELCMTPNELYEKKITEHCNVYDVLLCQRFFRFVFFMQKLIYDKENNIKIILQSLIPLTKKEIIIQCLTMFLKERQKVEEILGLLEYDINYKFDIQYTPFVTIGEKVIYPISVVAHSNLIRNTIAYSYLSGNRTVNDDGGLEPLVKVCAKSFEQCEYDYKVYTNQKYTYGGKHGEIDVLVIADEEIIVIECKEPLMPTSNFEMRATFEHINKASVQLDLSQKAFEDNGFKRKFFKDHLNLECKQRAVRTCIVLGNRLFSIWSGSKHPIRYIKELDMILTSGEIRSTFAKWSIWKNDVYSHEDLVDYLKQDGTFIKIMQESMDKYYETMKFNGKTILWESYMQNMEKLFLVCDEKLRLIEKNDEAWNEFLLTCKKNCEVSI